MTKLVLIIAVASANCCFGNTLFSAGNAPWEDAKPDTLYDQQFTASIDFQKLSDIQKLQYLDTTFESRIAQKARNRLIKHTLETLAAVAVSKGIVYAFSYYLKHSYPDIANDGDFLAKMKIAFQVPRDIYNAIGTIPSVILSAVVGFWGIPIVKRAFLGAQGLKNDIMLYINDYILKRRTPSKVEKLQREYFFKKLQMPLSMQRCIEYKLQALEKATENNETKNISVITESLMTLLAIYSNKSKSITPNLPLFNEEFQGYHQDIYNAYRLFYMGYVLSQQEQDHAHALCLQGPPGTGKTVSVQKIAKVLKANIIKISASDSLDKLFGSENSPGEIALQMSAVNDGRPMILFIDEFDRGNPNTEMLLKLLDPAQKTYFNAHYHCDLPLPSLRIIAGNKSIFDGALMNRIHLLNYTGFTIEYKKQILTQKMGQYLQELSRNKSQTMTMDELTVDQYALMMRIIENDQDKGLRTCEKILYWFAIYVIDKKYNPNMPDPDFLTILGQQNKLLSADFVK
jgi:hypothetical protein